MAKKRETVRFYKFSDAELIQVADGIIIITERDSEQMNDRGVDNERKTALIELRNKFSDTLPDKYYLGQQGIMTEAKETARARLVTLLRSVFAAAENVYGARSVQYKQMGDARLTKLTDDALVRNARHTAQIAMQRLGDLRSEGVTEAKITEITALNQSFDQAVDNLKTAERNREIASQERVEKGNALYTEMVKICNTGKDIWYETSEAKYNDYILYNTPSGKLEDEGQGANT